MVQTWPSFEDEGSLTSKERAREIMKRQDSLEQERALYEPTWEQVAQFCAPDSPPLQWKGRSSIIGTYNQAVQASVRLPEIYDTTIISAATRLAAGLESLIIPQSDKWHGISTDDIADEETQEEREWAENLRDLLFKIRYTPASNWVPSAQSMLENVVKFGPGYIYAEEGYAGQHVYYCSIPIQEAFIARNMWGVVDIFHRRYEESARALAQRVGYENLPRSIQKMVDDTDSQLQMVQVVQAIQPRDERKTYERDGETTYLDGEFASYHIVEDEEEIVMERDFHSFPISCFSWRRHQGDTYGISPTIMALTTVKEVNEVRRVGLRGMQQMVDPATASMSGIDYVPILNPGQNYPGLVNDQGRQLVVPINMGAKPELAMQYAQERDDEIRDMMFVNLFQVLAQNPSETATEALIKQNEKGELLGPAGSVIQSGLAANMDRELAILESKGLYEQGSRFVPPPSLEGKDIRATFTSPLDNLRRTAEAKDAIAIVTTASQYAQATQDPRMLDNIDGDQFLDVVRGAGRAPQRMFRRKEEVAAIRQARADAQKAQAGMAAMSQAAVAADKAVPALIDARNAGMLPPGMTGATGQPPAQPAQQLPPTPR